MSGQNKQKVAKAAKARISKITVARLYNMGNYEHVRYEITTDVPVGASAAQAFRNTVAILAGLKPVRKPFNYESIVASVAKPIDQMNEREKENRETDLQTVQRVEAARELRHRAIDKLDDVGGTSVKVDSKLNWEDDRDLPW